MKIKRQIIPFCFYKRGVDLVCNEIQRVRKQSSTAGDIVRVVKSDGEVEFFSQPLKASEVMLRFPTHLVCGSDSFFVGKKPEALREADELKLGDRYFLLPRQFFENNLSFIAFAKMLRPLRPLEVRRGSNGALRIHVPDDAPTQPLMSPGGLCTTDQLKKDYSALFCGLKSWKPKLETIRESSREYKRKMLYTASFKFRTRKTHRTASHVSPPEKSENDEVITVGRTVTVCNLVEQGVM